MALEVVRNSGTVSIVRGLDVPVTFFAQMIGAEATPWAACSYSSVLGTRRLAEFRDREDAEAYILGKAEKATQPA